MLATLRQRNFALLWFATLISRTGDWVLIIGLPIYVYLLTRSVLATSFTVVAGVVPQIALGSLAGVFVDRWDRKRIMVITNLLLALGLFPLLLVRKPDHVWIVYLVLFVETSLEQFFTPAESALLPTLVGEEHLVPANSLNSLVQNLSRLAGPAIGGLIAAAFGLTGIVLVDALSFLLAALLITGIAGVATAAPSTRPAQSIPSASNDTIAASDAKPRRAGGKVVQEWLAGLRVIRSERTLWVLLGAFAVSSLGEGVFGTLYPVFVYRVLHGAALQIGELMSAQAVGGLIGGLLVGWAGKRVLSRWVMGLCQVAFGLIDLAIFNTPAFFPFFWLSVGLFIAVGIPGVFSLTGAQSLLQATAPEAYLGRVFGVLGAMMGLFMLVGTLIAGTVTDHLGVVTILNIQGAVYVVAGIFLMLLLPRKVAATTAIVPGIVDAPETLSEAIHSSAPSGPAELQPL